VGRDLELLDAAGAAQCDRQAVTRVG